VEIFRSIWPLLCYIEETLFKIKITDLSSFSCDVFVSCCVALCIVLHDLTFNDHVLRTYYVSNTWIVSFNWNL